MFGSFVGLRKADYDLLDTFLNKFTIFQNVKYKRVVVSRHEENEEDPLLLVFEIELRGKKYILKVKKNMLPDNDEYALQKKAYKACPKGVIKPYKGDCFLFNNITYQFIVMEEGQKIEVIYRFTKEKIVKLFIDFLYDLETIRKSGIAHRDVKPGNLVYHEGRIKLIDFDFATNEMTTSSREQTRVRSGVFSAPEVMFCRRNGRYIYGNRALLFSVTMCMFLALNNGIYPGFKDMVRFEQISDIDIYEYNALKKSKKYTAPLSYVKDERLSAILAKGRAFHSRKRYKNEKAFAKALEKYLKGDSFPKRFSEIVTAMCVFAVIVILGMGVVKLLPTMEVTGNEKARQVDKTEIAGKNDTSTMEYNGGEEKEEAEESSYKMEVTYKIPRSYFKNRNGNISLFASLDLSTAGLSADKMKGLNVFVEGISENIVSQKCSLNVNRAELSFQSLVVRDQDNVIIRLYLKDGENNIIYERDITMEFEYGE